MKETIATALRWAVAELEKGGIEGARLDAEVLLAYLLQASRTQLYLQSDKELSQQVSEKFRLLVERRLSREPVAYITGTKEFMSLEFKVNENVLIPRPDTEILVEEVISRRPTTLADIGTGSGAIAVSAAYYLPEVKVVAVDISPKALKVAEENAISLGVKERVNFLEGDLLCPVINRDIINVDFITANLPYIPAELMPILPKDVKDYEPELALDGGSQGLDIYKELIKQVPKVLRPGGIILMEIGYDQGSVLSNYLKELKRFEGITILKDLSGKDRAVKAVLM